MSTYNYFLIALSLLLLTFITVSAKRRLIKKAWLRRSVNITAAAASVIMLLAAALFPNLSSVKTTGEFSFASAVIEFEDASRAETFKSDGSFRKISVSIHYPYDEKLRGAEKFPLIVFSHGGISLDTSNLSLYRELASHGYIVASISHTYHALSTKIGGKNIFTDSGYMNELNAEDSHTDIENSFLLFQKWMALRTGDINFVINKFLESEAIDADRIGVAGHSLGGSAAIGMARLRDDIKAAVILEAPFMCDITGVNGSEFTWNTEPYPCAVMNIYSDSAFPALVESDNKYAQNKNYLYNGENVEYYHIEGSNHYSLTDLSRTSPALCALLGGGYENGYETLEFINEKCVEFFEKHLRS